MRGGGEGNGMLIQPLSITDVLTNGNARFAPRAEPSSHIIGMQQKTWIHLQLPINVAGFFAIHPTKKENFSSKFRVTCTDISKS